MPSKNEEKPKGLIENNVLQKVLCTYSIMYMIMFGRKLIK